MRLLIRKRHLTRHAILVGIFLLAFAGLAAAQYVRAHRVRGRAHGTVQILHLTRLGRRYDVWVYRPAVRDSAKLPVIYFLHGLPGHPYDVFRYGRAEQTLDDYIARGGKPVVVAAPDGNSPLHNDTEWANASNGSDNLESFILTRVFHAVEGNHPRSAGYRAIAGLSMGGYGAMNIALQHPSLFGQIVSAAGYFHLDDLSHMFKTRASQRANNPDLNLGQARGHRVLLMDGLSDGDPLTQHQSQDFHARLARAGIPSTLIMAPGTHSWRYLATQLPAILRFLSAGWGKAPAPPTGGVGP